MVHLKLDADARAPAVARGCVADLLHGSGVDADTIADSCLAVSELATNAVVHTGAPFALDVSVDDDAIHVEVLDTSPLLPRRIPPTATTGRGLQIVEHLARRWGAVPVDGGKVVWCDLGLRHPAPTR